MNNDIEEIRKEFEEKIKDLDNLIIKHFLIELINKKSPQVKKKKNILESQFVLMILGFVLTGILGGVMNYFIQEQLSTREATRDLNLFEHKRDLMLLEAYKEKQLSFLDTLFTKIQEHKSITITLLHLSTPLTVEDTIKQNQLDSYIYNHKKYLKTVQYFINNKYSIKAKINTYFEDNISKILRKNWKKIEKQILSQSISPISHGMNRFARNIDIKVKKLKKTKKSQWLLSKKDKGIFLYQVTELKSRFDSFKVSVNSFYETSTPYNLSHKKANVNKPATKTTLNKIKSTLTDFISIIRYTIDIIIIFILIFSLFKGRRKAFFLWIKKQL